MWSNNQELMILNLSKVEFLKREKQSYYSPEKGLGAQ
jgi:hypothetical protein